MKIISKALAIFVYAAVCFAAVPQTGFTPLVNSSFTDTSLADWRLVPGTGATLDRVTSEYNSAPASMRFASPDTVADIDYFVWASKVDTGGIGWPTADLTTKFYIKASPAADVGTWYNVLLFDASPDTGWSYVGWVGFWKIDPFTTGGWDEINDVVDIANATSLWEYKPFKDTLFALAKKNKITVPAVKIVLRFEVKKDTIWLDDFDISVGGTGAIKPLVNGEFSGEDRFAFVNNSVRFATPTAYRLSVLDLNGRKISSCTGFGAQAMVPTRSLPAGAYMLRVMNAVYGSAAKSVQMVR